MALIPALQKIVKNHSTTFLSCIAASGVIFTSVLVAKEAPKARRELAIAEAVKDEPLTIVEKVKEVAPIYLPAIIVGTGTIACIFGIDSLSKKKIAALEGAYILLDQSYKEYKAKVREVCGDEVADHIEEEIAKDHYDRDGVIVATDKILFYDKFSKRYFESSMLEMSDAELQINKHLHLGLGRICANDAYGYMGLDWDRKYDELGWNIWAFEHEATYDPSYDRDLYSWVQLNYKLMIMDDGLECYMIEFNKDPYPDFLDY